MESAQVKATLSAASKGEAASQPQPQPHPQLVDYAFNVYAYATKIPDGVPKTVVMTLNAYEAGGTTWEQEAAEARNRGEEVFRQTLDFTPREFSANESEDGVRKYVLVGLTYPRLPARVLKLHDAQKKQRSVGTSIRNDALISSTDYQVPVLVVAPVIEKPTKNTHLFALIKPHEGLCHPFPVAQDAVFYLSMFRDGTTVARKRGPTWNKIIQKHSVRPSTDAHTPPPSGNDALSKFLNNNIDEWDDNDSQYFAREFHEKWPEAPVFSTDDVAIVKQQLADQGIVVERRLLRPFVIHAMRMMEKWRSFGVYTGRVAQEALDDVRVLFGGHESVVLLSDED